MALSAGSDTRKRPGVGFAPPLAARGQGRRLAMLPLAGGRGAAPCDSPYPSPPGAPETVYLLVGLGSFTGLYNAGGTPGSNARDQQGENR